MTGDRSPYRGPWGLPPWLLLAMALSISGLVVAGIYLFVRQPAISQAQLDCFSAKIAPQVDQCLDPYLEAAAEHPQKELDALQRLVDQGRIDSCHPAAHRLGHFALQEIGQVEAAFAAGDNKCLGGYLHGVVQAAVHEGGSQLTVSMCTDLADRDLRAECAHGLGHGLLDHVGHIREAIRDCDALQQETDIYDCRGGVLMQNIAQSTDLEEADFTAQVAHACDSLRGGVQEECFGQVGEVSVIYYQGEIDPALKLCSSLPHVGQEPCEIMAKAAAEFRG
jgi:hypothetical protein